MKFVCDTQKFSEICSNIQRSVSSKSTIPAIEGILLTTAENSVTVTGYDLEVGVITSVEAKVEEQGSIILKAKILCDILRNLPAQTVRIESDERMTTKIKSGESEFSLIGINAQEYPELPSVNSSFPIVVKGGILKDMIRKTIFATAENDTKVVHTGVRFEIGNSLIRLVAVDGFRLAIRNEAIDYQGDEQIFVVPKKTLNEIMKLIVNDDVAISLNIGKRHIVFEIGRYLIVSRLLDGEFLNYKSAIAINENTKVEITSNQTLYAQYSKNEYTLSFNPNGGAVSPVSKMVTYNSAYGTLPTPTRTGYTFNGWYTSTTGGVKVDSTTVLTENANKVIYARWTANTYTVTFVYNNGSSNTTKEVTYNSTYGVLPSVTKTGYTFKGWYTSQAGGTRVINTDTVKITSNQTLYAQYTQNTYTVTLKTDKGSISSSSWTVSSTTTTNDTATKKIAYDSTYSDLPVLTKAGYTFNGWYYNNTKIDNTTKLVVASNHTLNAKWTANTYTVTFNTNGGSAVS